MSTKQLKIAEIIATERCGFLLVSEVQELTRWICSVDKNKDPKVVFESLKGFIAKLGGKPGTIEWRKTGAPMKCWHGVFMADPRFVCKDIGIHVGQGCYKRLASGGEYEY
jgi:hypothetical protein